MVAVSTAETCKCWYYNTCCIGGKFVGFIEWKHRWWL